MAGAPCFIISDWSGYITATNDPKILAWAVEFETSGGPGTLRELVTGEPQYLIEPPPRTPEAFPSVRELLGDLFNEEGT